MNDKIENDKTGKDNLNTEDNLQAELDVHLQIGIALNQKEFDFKAIKLILDKDKKNELEISKDHNCLLAKVAARCKNTFSKENGYPEHFQNDFIVKLLKYPDVIANIHVYVDNYLCTAHKYAILAGNKEIAELIEAVTKIKNFNLYEDIELHAYQNPEEYFKQLCMIIANFCKNNTSSPSNYRKDLIEILSAIRLMFFKYKNLGFGVERQLEIFYPEDKSEYIDKYLTDLIEDQISLVKNELLPLFQYGRQHSGKICEDVICNIEEFASNMGSFEVPKLAVKYKDYNQKDNVKSFRDTLGFYKLSFLHHLEYYKNKNKVNKHEDKPALFYLYNFDKIERKNSSNFIDPYNPNPQRY